MLRFLIRLPAEFAKLLIRIYQFTLSFDHAFWAKYVNMRVCIYHPSCSEYTYQAIDRFGFLQGSVMGFFRILRCNSLNPPGLDPVPEHFSIKRNSVTGLDK